MAEIRNLKEIEAHIRHGRHEDAAELVFDVWFKSEGKLAPSLSRVLDDLVDYSPTAAYLKAHQMIDQENYGLAEKYLKTALKSKKEKVCSAANMMMTVLLLDRNRENQAVPYLKASASAGHASAKHLLAHAYLEAQMGLKKNIPEAVKLLKSAVQSGYPGAKVSLAQLIIDKVVLIPEYDPIQLLMEAAAEGDTQAFGLILAMGLSGPNQDDEPLDRMLPYKVVPDGMERPKLVRDALGEEIQLSKDEAEEIAACLFGYPDWERLSKAANDPDLRKGVFDEDLEYAAYNERTHLQASVLCSFVEIPEVIAKLAVDLLRPTSSVGKPSLKRLQERVEDAVIPMAAEEFVKNGHRNLEAMGLTGDLEKAMRTANRARADVWLRALEQACGWVLEKPDYEANADGALVATSRSMVGDVYDIYISRASHNPCDKNDDHVFKLSRDIETKSKCAVLLFNRPLVHIPKGRKDHGLLYGGMFLRNGTWNDFVLTPEGGLDSAIAQKLHFKEKMDREIVSAYGFKGAVSLGRTIACFCNDLDPDDMSIVPCGEMYGWMSYVPIELAKLM